MAGFDTENGEEIVATGKHGLGVGTDPAYTLGEVPKDRVGAVGAAMRGFGYPIDALDGLGWGAGVAGGTNRPEDVRNSDAAFTGSKFGAWPAYQLGGISNPSAREAAPGFRAGMAAAGMAPFAGPTGTSLDDDRAAVLPGVIGRTLGRAMGIPPGFGVPGGAAAARGNRVHREPIQRSLEHAFVLPDVNLALQGLDRGGTVDAGPGLGMGAPDRPVSPAGGGEVGTASGSTPLPGLSDPLPLMESGGGNLAGDFLRLPYNPPDAPSWPGTHGTPVPQEHLYWPPNQGLAGAGLVQRLGQAIFIEPHGLEGGQLPWTEASASGPIPRNRTAFGELATMPAPYGESGFDGAGLQSASLNDPSRDDWLAEQLHRFTPRAIGETLAKGLADELRKVGHSAAQIAATAAAVTAAVPAISVAIVYPGATRNARALLGEFLTGSGDEIRYFGPTSPFTRELFSGKAAQYYVGITQAGIDALAREYNGKIPDGAFVPGVEYRDFGVSMGVQGLADARIEISDVVGTFTHAFRCGGREMSSSSSGVTR